MDVRTGTARVSGIDDDLEIHYEDMGKVSDPPVLLIMGLGAQLLLWRKGFCERLVNLGYRVIRYDNRDVGLSGKLHGRRAGGSLIPALVRSFVGRRSESVYTLEHMADDAAGLLDHLEIDRAHIAARFPERTSGLGIIFSSNNSALLPPPAPRALLALIKGPPPDSPLDVLVENSIRVSRIIGSPGYPVPEEKLRAEAIEGYERSHYPQGIARHFGAILGTGSLVRYDRQITAPTVVIHGRDDKLMRPAGGRAIASAIPNARLVLFDGMAHDLPEELWDDIIGELQTTFAEMSDTR